MTDKRKFVSVCLSDSGASGDTIFYDSTNDIFVYGSAASGGSGTTSDGPYGAFQLSDGSGNFIGTGAFDPTGSSIYVTDSNVACGTLNTSLGIGAGQASFCLSTTENTFIGASAGSDTNTGSTNTFVGSNSGKSNTSGNCNTFMGVCSGLTNTTGEGNVFLGYYAGKGRNGSTSDVVIGSFAGSNATAGDCNIYIGASAGACAGYNKETVAIGFESGCVSTGYQILL